MILAKYTVREVKSHPGRAILTLASIVIGVAAVVSVRLSSNSTRQAYKEMFASMTGRAAFEIVGQGDGTTFYETVLDKIDKIPGVKVTVPCLRKATRLRDAVSTGENKRKTDMIAMGIDPAVDRQVRDYEVSAGQYLDINSEGAMIEGGFAEGLGLKLGDTIKLHFKAGLISFKIQAILSPTGAAEFNQGGIVFLPLPLLQKYIGERGRISSADVVIEDGANENAVRDAIAAALPGDVSVRLPPGKNPLSQGQMKKTEDGLTYAFAQMVILAVLLILNTFLMNVSERRRQISILRAIGTTRRQIVRSLLIEGLILGILGTALGSFLGIFGAQILTGTMSKTFSASVPPVHLSPGPFILAGILGPGMALFAMFIPARIAGKVSPLEGMRPDVTKPNTPIPIKWIVAGIATFFITGGALVGCIMGVFPVMLAPFAGAIFTAAFVCLVPAVLEPLTNGVAWVFKPLLRAEGHVAARQLVRRRARSTLTIGVLYISVSTSVALGTVINNNIENVQTWFRSIMPGDLFIRSASFQESGPSTAGTGTMSDEIAEDLGKIAGVTRVQSVRFLFENVEGQEVLMVARPFDDISSMPLFLVEPKSVPEVQRVLTSGQVAIGTVLAQKLNKRLGDTIQLPTADGIRPFQIGALTTEYFGGGMVVNLDIAAAKRAQVKGVQGANVLIVFGENGRMDQIRADVKKRIAEEQGLIVYSFSDLKVRLDATLNGVIASLWGIIVLGLFVSGLGIANTLTMNVLEQTRDLALLRVVAMTRRQVRKTIMSQAAILGIIGLTTGTLGGLVGAYTTNITSAAMSGDYVLFKLDPLLAVGSFAASFLIVMAAAWIPAVRASKLNLLIALKYE